MFVGGFFRLVWRGSVFVTGVLSFSVGYPIFVFTNLFLLNVVVDYLKTV